MLSKITEIPWLFLNDMDPVLENGNITWIGGNKNQMFLYQFDIPEKWLK